MEISDLMLFRWVGYDIEKPKCAHHPANKRPALQDIPDLTKEAIERYLSFLLDALDPKKGLKIGAFSNADRVGPSTPATSPLPCLFFTEQAAGNSEKHWSLYGRLGFGFSKRFIYQCGGRPVIYTQGDAADPIVAAVESLRKLEAKARVQKWKGFGGQLELLARFIKCTKLPGLQKPEQPRAARKRAAKPEFRQCDYPKHNPIRFLSEREWRLLVDTDSNRFHEIKGNGRDAGWWFRPKLGLELQMIILPNNYFLKKAMSCDVVRKRLSEDSKQPVQLISAQALQKL